MFSSSLNKVLFIKIKQNPRSVEINNMIIAGLISNKTMKTNTNNKLVIVSSGLVKVKIKLNLKTCKLVIENLLIIKNKYGVIADIKISKQINKAGIIKLFAATEKKLMLVKIKNIVTSSTHQTNKACPKFNLNPLKKHGITSMFLFLYNLFMQYKITVKLGMTGTKQTKNKGK